MLQKRGFPPMGLHKASAPQKQQQMPAKEYIPFEKVKSRKKLRSGKTTIDVNTNTDTR